MCVAILDFGTAVLSLSLCDSLVVVVRIDWRTMFDHSIAGHLGSNGILDAATLLLWPCCAVRLSRVHTSNHNVPTDDKMEF